MEASYYAVIFASKRKSMQDPEYDRLAAEMAELAPQQNGYLGMISQRAADGNGITVSYWHTEADLKAWKQVSEHLYAQKMGRERFYSHYKVEVCRVERAYAFGE